MASNKCILLSFMILWATWAQVGGSSAPHDIGAGGYNRQGPCWVRMPNLASSWLAVSAGCLLEILLCSEKIRAQVLSKVAANSG